jgi:hypothetical protein
MGSGIQVWWWPGKWPKLVTCVINCGVHDGTYVDTFINARLVIERRLYALKNDKVHYNQRRDIVACVGLRRSMFSGFAVFCPGVWGNVNAAGVLRPCWCFKCISHPGFFFKWEYFEVFRTQIISWCTVSIWKSCFHFIFLSIFSYILNCIWNGVYWLVLTWWCEIGDILTNVTQSHFILVGVNERIVYNPC